MVEYGSRDGNTHFRSRHPQGVVIDIRLEEGWRSFPFIEICKCKVRTLSDITFVPIIWNFITRILYGYLTYVDYAQSFTLRNLRMPKTTRFVCNTLAT